jgi:pre-mRNA-processing factor 6
VVLIERDRDIKRARMLFDSLVKSNPKHAPGWIAAACVEEHAGRMVAARKIIKLGCERCPTSEDVWLEAARLHVRHLSVHSLLTSLTDTLLIEQ